MRETCSTCKHWDEDNRKGQNSKVGTCRLNPPTLYDVSSKMFDVDAWSQPITHSDDRCSHWRWRQE